MTANDMRMRLAERFYEIALTDAEDMESRVQAADIALCAMLDAEGRTRFGHLEQKVRAL